MFDLLYKAKKISNFKSLIHIGGHIGEEVDFYKSLHLEKVIFVEPVKQFADEISRKIRKLENFEIYRFALGNENKKLKIYIADDGIDNISSGSTSLLQPRKSEINFSKTEIIDLKKYSDLKIKTIDCAVIDTQGYELEVLKGFEEKIQNFKIIVVEFSNYEGYVGQVLYKNLHAFMSNNNFALLKQNKKTNKIIPNIHSGSYGDSLYVNIELLTPIQRITSSFRYFLLNNIFFDTYNKYLDFTLYKTIIKRYIRKFNY
tara:strand:- start:60736 stop:61509 length:774 start_codon:yes stop_codon:yes gene_type:complete